MLEAIAAAYLWPIDGGLLYDEWGARNKASQRDEPEWIPFAEHCSRSLAATYADLGLIGRPAVDAAVLLDSVGGWPLWPDVAAGLPALGTRYRTGVLSNVDHDVFARTAVAPSWASTWSTCAVQAISWTRRARRPRTRRRTSSSCAICPTTAAPETRMGRLGAATMCADAQISARNQASAHDVTARQRRVSRLLS